MSKYIVQLRRGTKEQWQEYEKNNPTDSMPLAGELVLEYDNGIPRLKIGDGISPYSQLPYMSVDSFILPKPASVTIYANKWEQVADNKWCQTVTVNNATITPGSKVDLQPDSEQLVIFYEKDLAFVTENEDGVVTVFCIGQKPTSDYTMQATVTEVIVNE